MCTRPWLSLVVALGCGELEQAEAIDATGTEGADGAGGSYPDSAGGNDGTAMGTTASGDGIAGTALALDGTGGEVAIGDPGDDSLDFDHGSFSFELWTYVPSTVRSFDMPWYKGGSSTGNVGYDFELGGGSWNAAVSSKGVVVVSRFGAAMELDDEWAHLVAVIDREANLLRAYANGDPVEQSDISALGSLSTNIEAGIGRTDNYFYNGVVDEVRVYEGVLSPAWIAAEHANLTDPAFVTVHAQESAP